MAAALGPVKPPAAQTARPGQRRDLRLTDAAQAVPAQPSSARPASFRPSGSNSVKNGAGNGHSSNGAAKHTSIQTGFLGSWTSQAGDRQLPQWQLVQRSFAQTGNGKRCQAVQLRITGQAGTEARWWRAPRLPPEKRSLALPPNAPRLLLRRVQPQRNGADDLRPMTLVAANSTPTSQARRAIIAIRWPVRGG